MSDLKKASNKILKHETVQNNENLAPDNSQPNMELSDKSPVINQIAQKPIQHIPRARRPDMELTKDEQDMQSQIVENPHNKQMADRLTMFKENYPLSPKQKEGITELFKLIPETPKPTPAEKKDLKEKSDDIIKIYELDELTDKQQKELVDILTTTPAQPTIRVNPNLPKPKFTDEQQKKFDKFMEDKGFENKAPEVKQLYQQAFQAVLISELQNRNDAVDKDLEVQFQDAEKFLYGVDTPVETLQVGVTDNDMELLDRICATDGFQTLEEEAQEQQKATNEKTEDNIAAMDAALDELEDEIAQENSSSPGMRF